MRNFGEIIDKRKIRICDSENGTVRTELFEFQFIRGVARGVEKEEKAVRFRTRLRKPLYDLLLLSRISLRFLKRKIVIVRFRNDEAETLEYGQRSTKSVLFVFKYKCREKKGYAVKLRSRNTTKR